MSDRIAGYMRDVLTLSGCGLVTYGVWRIHAPAGIITAGIFLLAAGLAGALRG